MTSINKAKAAIILLCIILASCGREGYLKQCKTGCASGEFRDLFCNCVKRSNAGNPGFGGGENDIFAPFLQSKSLVSDECILQSERWIFNPNKKAVDVRIGSKNIDADGHVDTEYVWHTVGSYAADFQSGYYLGHQYVGKNCFDKDYFISTWQFNDGRKFFKGTKLSIANLEEISRNAPAALSVMDPITRSIAINGIGNLFKYTGISDGFSLESYVIKQLILGENKENIIIRQIPDLDCPALCRSGDFKCWRTRPADQDKLLALRDKILNYSTGNIIAIEGILSIFNIKENACERSNIVYGPQGEISNDGEICSYPLALISTSKLPVAKMQLGHNVNGWSSRSNSGGIIEFGKPYASPNIKLTSDVLDLEYGGIVRRILANEIGVYFTTVRGCVSMELKK